MNDCTDTIPSTRSIALTGLMTTGRFFTRAFRAVFEARERAAQRQLLGSLDDRMLKDLGLSRADVTREISKPFWSR